MLLSKNKSTINTTLKMLSNLFHQMGLGKLLCIILRPTLLQTLQMMSRSNKLFDLKTNNSLETSKSIKYT
jgi:hypothetical protein